VSSECSIHPHHSLCILSTHEVFLCWWCSEVFGGSVQGPCRQRVDRLWRALRHGSMELPRLEASASSSEEVADALLSAGACVLTRAASSASASATARELNSQTGFSGAKGSFAGTDSRRNAGKPIGESTGAAELAVAQCVLAPVRAILTKWCRRVALGTCSHITVVHPPEGEPPHPPQVSRNQLAGTVRC